MESNKVSGKKEFVYTLVMTNGEFAETSIYSANDVEKATYLRHFLEAKHLDAENYFVDNLTRTMYNKHHIVSCKEKKEESQNE